MPPGETGSAIAVPLFAVSALLTDISPRFCYFITEPFASVYLSGFLLGCLQAFHASQFHEFCLAASTYTLISMGSTRTIEDDQAAPDIPLANAFGLVGISCTQSSAKNLMIVSRS
jgi:hypothetical protein